MNMLNIKFYPDSDRPELEKATREYQKIWEKEGKRIVEVMERISGLKFKERLINVLVYEVLVFLIP